MSVPIIPATTPVVSPASEAITYDKWYLTQVVMKSTPTTCPTVITLTRASQAVDGSWTLMPSSQNSSITFNVDIFSDIKSGDTAMGSAMESFVAAISAYATAKKLL